MWRGYEKVSDRSDTFSPRGIFSGGRKGTMRKSAKTFTLIVWEEVPESTKIVLIPNDVLMDLDVEIFRTAQGRYINLDNTPEQEKALDCINNALTSDEGCLSEDHPKGSRWAMRFAEYLQEFDKPIEDKMITRVFVMGFLC